jgi:mRNA interferase MazF
MEATRRPSFHVTPRWQAATRFSSRLIDKAPPSIGSTAAVSGVTSPAAAATSSRRASSFDALGRRTPLKDDLRPVGRSAFYLLLTTRLGFRPLGGLTLHPVTASPHHPPAQTTQRRRERAFEAGGGGLLVQGQAVHHGDHGGHAGGAGVLDVGGDRRRAGQVSEQPRRGGRQEQAIGVGRLLHLGAVGVARGFVCPFTSGDAEASIFRTPVEPTARNGLRAASRLMADKITSIPRSKLGSRMGRLDDDDVVRLDRAMLVFLGLAVTPRKRTGV